MKSFLLNHPFGRTLLTANLFAAFGLVWLAPIPAKVAGGFIGSVACWFLLLPAEEGADPPRGWLEHAFYVAGVGAVLCPLGGAVSGMFLMFFRLTEEVDYLIDGVFLSVRALIVGFLVCGALLLLRGIIWRR